jgi:energy-coupling factor transporter ATP-binding protein EcfA2
VEIDFTTFELACIAGPNGAGKSSLLDAITWVLFGQARKRDDSLINSRASAAQVDLVFAYEGNIYRVMRVKPREKTALLEFQILQDGDRSAVDNQPSSIAQRLSSGVWKPLSGHSLRETERVSSRRCAWITRPSPMPLSSCKVKPTSLHSSVPVTANGFWAVSWAWMPGMGIASGPASDDGRWRKRSPGWKASCARSTSSLTKRRAAKPA